MEINPQAARRPSDRLEEKNLRPDASNLAAALAHLREETATDGRPNGAISDISIDLASLIPSVRTIEVSSDPHAREYSFDVSMNDAVRTVDPDTRRSVVRTRMRTGLRSDALQLDPETDLNRHEVQNLLQQRGNAA